MPRGRCTSFPSLFLVLENVRTALNAPMILLYSRLEEEIVHIAEDALHARRLRLGVLGRERRGLRVSSGTCKHIACAVDGYVPRQRA